MWSVGVASGWWTVYLIMNYPYSSCVCVFFGSLIPTFCSIYLLPFLVCSASHIFLVTADSIVKSLS